RCRRAGIQGRGQKKDLLSMGRQIALDGLGVQPVEVLRRVEDRPGWEELEHDRKVSELEVQVDQGNLIARSARDRDGKVGSNEALAAATLRAEYGDDLVIRRRRR